MALVIFMVSSAYLVLELVIALSGQGEPTGAVAPFTGAQVIYPNWYQAPEFLDAAWVALVAYPVALIFYGIAAFVVMAGRATLEEQSRMPLDVPGPESTAGSDGIIVPANEASDDLCVVSTDRRIQHITLSAAGLFGLTPRDMLGQSLEAFLSPIDLPKLDALVAAAYADQPQAFATTVGVILPDAAVAPVDITCRAGVGGGAAGAGTAVLTIRPLSERGRLDDQLAALWY
jgi:hypothetical protein